MKKLGILGGMGPMATADFYQKIVLLTHALSESEHIHTVIESNPLIPDRTAYINGLGTSPIQELMTSLKRLESAGAEVIAMPCNTAHYFYDDLQASTQTTFLNMIDETIQYTMKLNAHGPMAKIGLLATGGTYASEIYQTIARRYDMELFIPDDPIKKLLMEAIYALKSARYEVIPHLQSEIYSYLDQCNLSAWILGCTELPIILKDGIQSHKLIDSSMVLAKAAILAVGGKIEHI